MNVTARMLLNIWKPWNIYVIKVVDNMFFEVDQFG
jgi:hypothetical protein